MYKLFAVTALGLSSLLSAPTAQAGVDVGIAIGVPFVGAPYYYGPGPVWHGPSVVYRDYGPRGYYHGGPRYRPPVIYAPRFHHAPPYRGYPGRPYARGYRDGYRDSWRDDRRGRGHHDRRYRDDRWR